MGWFLDKKKRPEKNFVYTHIVPVDIHMLIHSLPPLFWAISAVFVCRRLPAT